MQKLIEGLHRFQSEVFGPHRELFAKLAKGQSPEVMFITCSDSRINPALITQTRPGDLFVLRNAGNIVPAYSQGSQGEAASIEFALVGLKVQHIVVCGHSGCGAMKGLLDPKALEPLPVMKEWLKNAQNTQRIMKENYQHLHGDALVTATAEENVLVQLENLRTHPAVRERLDNRTLTLHGWVYKLETGQVFNYEPVSGQFVPLVAQKPQDAESRTPERLAG
ncbi:carbonic anhydrase [Hyalangium versicolor]|uniref:carbonic anhydrase n=1 Tax=Hyalangium versicolor TaxID=2861190 RepID=UPI001CCEB869|nr:carbonic anhydrase [Hyalangium versicolor]